MNKYNNPRIQYYHSYGKLYIGRDHTVCLEVPTKQHLMDLVNLKMNTPMAAIAVNFGITYLHEKDYYCYRTGREKSLYHCGETFFNLVSVDFREDTCVFRLTYGDHLILLETKEHREKPHFIKYVNIRK